MISDAEVEALNCMKDSPFHKILERLRSAEEALKYYSQLENQMTKPTDMARLRQRIKETPGWIGVEHDTLTALLDELEALRWQHGQFKSLSMMKRMDLQIKPALEELKKLREFKTEAMRLLNLKQCMDTTELYREVEQFIKKWSEADE